MTIAPAKPAPLTRLSRYPNYVQAKSYLVNFLGRGRRHYFKTSQYAKYQFSSTIGVIVICLAPHIYEVRAFPLDSFIVGSLEEAQAVDPFRGWIFAQDPRSRSTTYITGTMREGVELYNLHRKAIRHEATLTRADFYYRKLLASR